MSRLYHSEEGRVMPSLCEELSTFRRARKHLGLPATGAPAQLWILARSHPENGAPLHVRLNGADVADVVSQKPGAYQWECVDVPPEALREGTNTVELWTDTTGFTGWSLALEAGHPVPASELSDDGGDTWRGAAMGYLNAVLAEYVVRIRLGEGEDDAPGPVV